MVAINVVCGKRSTIAFPLHSLLWAELSGYTPLAKNAPRDPTTQIVANVISEILRRPSCEWGSKFCDLQRCNIQCFGESDRELPSVQPKLSLNYSFVAFIANCYTRKGLNHIGRRKIFR